jgi:predicted phosphodiesterase
MKILVMSDLHFEFHKDEGNDFIASLSPYDTAEVDVLVLAGDIGVHPILSMALYKLCHKYKSVVFVAGNHDYSSTIEKTEEHFNYVSRRNKNFHWLNNSSVVIGGCRFIGSTLWFPRYGQQKRYSGFCQIEDFEPWANEQNALSFEYLAKELTSDDILVSHFYPFKESTHQKYAVDDELNKVFYAGERIDLLVKQRLPRLAIHGHTHSSFDYQIKNTRVVCNPFGYVRIGENREFDEHKIVQV